MEKRKPFTELSKRQKNRRLGAMWASENEGGSSSTYISKALEDDMDVANSDNSSTVTNNSIIDEEIDNVEPSSSGHDSPDAIIIDDGRMDHIDRSSPDHDSSGNSESENEMPDYDYAQNFVPDEQTLAAKLCVWALSFGINHSALTALLLILKIILPMERLPRDARTLLRTPRKTIIRPVAPGNYFHHGLKKGITDELTRNRDHSEIEDVISVDIGIDGLPLAKSSGSQLWPILGRIKHKIRSWNPFIIGVYHGNKKPNSVTEFLQDLIAECRVLMNEGFQFRNKHLRVEINAVICDTPARTFVKCIKAHNAYFGCGQCIEEGDYVHHRVLFLNDDACLRTDENFRERFFDEHHTGNSPFEMLPLKMVTQFPLEYMHLCCLGVMKKLIGLLLRGHHAARLSGAQIQQLSDMLVSLSKWVPMEFQRKCRSLREFDRWKATELRLLMLYLGPVVLKKWLPAQYYKHFNSFNCAMRILCHPSDCLTNNQYARDLLLYFVREMKRLYGQENLVYNVHNLIHLNGCVKTYGPLDSFSAFPFENYMQKLKKLLRKSEAPLAQIHRRIHEQTESILPREDNRIFPYMEKPIIQLALPFGCNRPHATLRFLNFTLSTCDSDNCCYFNDERIVVIDHFAYKNEEAVILGRSYLNPIPINGYPCNSGLLNIYSVKELTDTQVWPIRLIRDKAFRIPFDDTFTVMPLLHCSHTQ